jgi:NosR/NirI family nitrous oxide reductase transcriptional regulator
MAALAGLLLLLAAAASSQDRFPRPEFESGYTLPQIQEPQPRPEAWLVVDAAALAAAIFVSAVLVLKKRSRIGIVALSAVSLVYFGFVRKGCICPIGSIQNVTQSLFDTAYGISIPTAVFFILPIAAALFTGRTYCAGVCPFGALQDLVHVKTLRVPRGSTARSPCFLSSTSDSRFYAPPRESDTSSAAGTHSWDSSASP